jgi:uncharacterized delta-60 repeat protein
MSSLFKNYEKADDRARQLDGHATPVWLILFLTFMSLTMGGIAQVRQAWVSRYDGPASGDDRAFAVRVDAQGNVYVAGTSTGAAGRLNYATVKYDRNGNQRWVARYHGPGDHLPLEVIWYMALDSRGNVYVAGISPGTPATNYDCVIIRYDPNGNPTWLERYDGPGHDWDVCENIYVDADDNVYVAGWSMGVGTDFDAFALKYDRAGNRLWEVRYDGPGHGLDGAEVMRVDAMGNVYIAGPSTREDGSRDYFTAKYDPNGNVLWVARYSPPGTNANWAEDLILDEEGNVYVTGFVSGDRVDMATIKYDTDGNLLWEALYRGPANGPNEAWRMALDRAGGVYVTGSSTGIDTDRDIATIRYDRDGNEVWVKRYNGPGNGPDVGFNIASDPQGNAYVVGWSQGIDTDLDIVTIKYDASGTQRWIQRYNGPGNGIDSGYFITLDTENNVYVSGESKGVGTGPDFVTIKYSQR